MNRTLFLRLLRALPILLAASSVVFFLIHLVPGDPVDLMLGDRAGTAAREELRTELHLNEPILEQYGRFLANLARGDLGISISYREPVFNRICHALPATIELSFVALIIALLIAIPTGLFAAAQRGKLLDKLTMGLTLIGLSMPNFWLGPLLIYFLAYRLDWFPISGKEEAASVFLPAFTLGFGMSALLSRMTRSTVIDLLSEPYIRTAQAKGLGPVTLWGKHILRNAVLPLVTILGLQTGALLSGSIVTEKIFSWPGIGLELVEAIERRDYPLVQGCVLTIAVTYVVIHLLVDLLYVRIDPRLRISGTTS